MPTDKPKTYEDLQNDLEMATKALEEQREETRLRISERLDVLFAEARSWEFMVLNEANRVEMQQMMTKMAGGGWEVHTFTAFPDPKHKSGRVDPNPNNGDPDDMENLGIIYVALMRRGGQIVRK